MNELPESLQKSEENNASVQVVPTTRPRRLRRSVFVLPSLFTVANLLCGYYAIISAMNNMYQHAAIAIAIAIVLDSMDGFIARLTNTASEFGLQLDSLADIISFGVAPSILVLVWGFSGVNARLSCAVAFTFTICGAMRLARFNIQSGHRKHFVGLPIPAAGGTIAAIVYFFDDPISSSFYTNCMVVVTFILAFLMVSTVRYNSLKGITLGKKSHLTVLVIAIFFVLIFFLSRPTLLTLAVAYTLSGPAFKVFGLIRRKKREEDAIGPANIEM